MAFNKYQWGLYLKAGGQKTVQRFQDYLEGKLDDYPELIKELVGGFCPDIGIVQEQYDTAKRAVVLLKELHEINDTASENELTETAETVAEPTNPHELVRADWERFRKDYPNLKRPGIAFGQYIFNMVASTHIWSYYEPAVFLPYLFQQCFNVLTSIADMFDIELPPIPGKAQYEKRLLYYADLCNVFILFANENDLSTEELFAFLYEYAPACVGGIDWITEEIPDPRDVFVFGYGADYPENDPTRKWICQGSPDMQPGDIGLLYHWAPDSCYTSIWRAISPGFYDPLGSHDRYVCYGSPILIPRIAYADLKADPIFKETSLVKMNMLRMDGTPMLPSEYMHLLEMARSKGEVPENVPVFELRKDIEHGELLLERDVEAQLLEPLLLRLGWKPENWCRQMPVRVGRGISKYPDYVINPTYAKYNERGEIVLEAKLTIPSKKQVEHDRGQANSYAKLLGARAYVLVAKEGIWIAEKEDGFSEIKGYTWQDLEKVDVFTKVYDVIGNKKKNTQKKK